ncbi:MAG: FeoB-associated Cys-rich membrane protein [Deltaproteobacteria bacterium]|nr:FeoB-associated Cys-rich membrane protein [Deltaproteobacteria bacterium]
MSLTDILQAGIILGLAVYIIYWSIWKKKGMCDTCGNASCCTEKGTDDDYGDYNRHR